MAMTLADIRTKYPQYKDVPDQTLADKLYEKFGVKGLPEPYYAG